MATAMAVAGAAALALPGAADAGGYATVGLSSVPDGTAPGATWRVTLTVLQHGVTPLTGVDPVVRIRSADGHTTRTFPATPEGRPGAYRANVVFPVAGRWAYEVDDGFSQTHRFAPVHIGGAGAAAATPAAAPARGAGGDLGSALAAAAGAGVAAALLAVATIRRRRRSVAAPAAAPR
jgi:hypothetical protein